jgi:biotin transport system substrate-specific component
MKTRELTKMSICIALLCVSAYISFPLPFTPAMVTALTVMVNLIGLILTPKQSAIVMGVYILLGICGIPVFVGGTAGLGKVFGPTGGFILGFLVAAPVISLLKGKSNDIRRYLMITILVGMPIIYVFGVVGMIIVLKMNIVSALMAGVVPFVFGDVVKCIASSFLGVKLNQSLPKMVNA